MYIVPAFTCSSFFAHYSFYSVTLGGGNPFAGDIEPLFTLSTKLDVSPYT